MLLFQQNLQAGGSTNYTLTGLAGSYNVSGSTATLTKTSSSVNYTLVGLVGSYSVSGSTATLTKTTGSTAYSLVGLSGSYGVSGSTASLTWSGEAPILRPKGAGKGSNLKKTQTTLDDNEVFDLIMSLVAAEYI